MKPISLRPCTLFVLGALMTLSGCASIVNGTTQQMTINSNITDADITANGKPVGRTPFTGLVERGSKTSLTVSKAGYQSKTITLASSLEPWFWGNIIFGGLFGSTTDSATGAAYKYAPTTVEVDLEPAPAAAPEAAPAGK